MTSADLSSFFPPLGKREDLGFHTGQVMAWDPEAGTNTVRVLGVTIENVPTLTSAGITAIVPGATVGVLRYKTTYFILGRVVPADDPLIAPQIPVILYPQFLTLGSAGVPNEWHASVTSNTNWFGSAKIAQPYIELDGLWGPYGGGTNTTQYELRVNSQTVGTWTASTPELIPPASRKGPFDVSQFMGASGWQDIEVTASSVSGTGSYYFQIIGAWFASTA